MGNAKSDAGAEKFFNGVGGLLEKGGKYTNSKSGSPLVQHALPILLELYHQNKISLEKIV